MFGMFPFGMGNMISFTSFTSFTSTKDGINGFNVTNGYSGFFEPNQANNFNQNMNNINGMNLLDHIQSAVTSVLNNVDIEKLAEEYYTAISDTIRENSIEDDYDFIDFERNDDMYILRIDLKGIDLRELSIRYDPGILDINLKRSEYDNNSYRGYTNNIVKKKYNTIFDNIEEIDTDRVLKSIDNGIFTMRMPKKYALDSASKIIEVENYTVDNEKDKVIKKM